MLAFGVEGQLNWFLDHEEEDVRWWVAVDLELKRPARHCPAQSILGLRVLQESPNVFLEVMAVKSCRAAMLAKCLEFIYPFASLPLLAPREIQTTRHRLLPS